MREEYWMKMTVTQVMTKRGSERGSVPGVKMFVGEMPLATTAMREMAARMPRMVRNRRKKVRVRVARTKSGRRKEAASRRSRRRVRGRLAATRKPAWWRSQSMAASRGRATKRRTNTDFSSRRVRQAMGRVTQY